MYEIPMHLPGSFAISDMRALAYTEPDCTEIYFVLEGTAIVVVGTQEYIVAKGDFVVARTFVAHYVVHGNDCIMGALNLPVFNIENYIPITETNAECGFDREQFARLAALAIYGK